VKQPVTKGAEIFIEIGNSHKNIGFLLPTHHIMEGKEEYEGRRQTSMSIGRRYYKQFPA
jgi:hypothetical protein